MSGFEDYPQELSRIDREIFHYAAVCAVDLGDAVALKQCLGDVHDEWSEDKARQSLRGLLMLRLKVEAEMIERGLVPPPLLPSVVDDTDATADNVFGADGGRGGG